MGKLVPLDIIENKIFQIRGKRVMIITKRETTKKRKRPLGK